MRCLRARRRCVRGSEDGLGRVGVVVVADGGLGIVWFGDRDDGG